MSDDDREAALSDVVGLDRRGFIKRLVAGAAFAVPVIQSFDMAGVSAATCLSPGTRTFLSDSPDPSTAGQSVTLTGLVRFASGGAGPGVGSVEFFDGGTSLGTAPVDSGTSTAVLMTTAIGVGDRTLTAVYSGFAPDNCLPSSSPPVGHTVTAAPYPLQVGEPVAGPAAATAEPLLVSDDGGQSALPAAVVATTGLTAAAALAYRRSHPTPTEG